MINFILCNGWAAATTRQYAAAVNKFVQFVSSLGVDDFLLPASSHQVYHFILWCSTSSPATVSSNTIKRYLTGLWRWHTLHDFVFPAVSSHRICLLLKACAKTEVKRSRRNRVGLVLRDVLDLSDALTTGNQANLDTKGIILVGFWGLASLGELTLHPDHPDIFLRRKDVYFSSDGKYARVRLRMAKTAAHDDLKFLRLRAQPNMLEPVNVLHEILKGIPGSPNDPLFPGKESSIPMDRPHVVNFLKANGPQDENQWNRHSLRIGGASFQYDAGRPLTSLKRLGRWRSSAYKTYTHKYSPLLRRQTTLLSAALHF